MEEIMSFLAAIAAFAGIVYFFGWVQKKSGVTLVQNNFQRNKHEDGERLSSNMLFLKDQKLVENAQANCIKKGERLTWSNILLEVSKLENQQKQILKSQGQKSFDLDFNEILKEAEIRAGRNWWKTPEQKELSACLNMIKYERYTKEAFALNTKLSNEIIGALFREIISSSNLLDQNGLLKRNLNSKEYREIKELMISRITELNG